MAAIAPASGAQCGLIVADNVGSAQNYVQPVMNDPRLDTVFFGRLAVRLKKRRALRSGRIHRAPASSNPIGASLKMQACSDRPAKKMYGFSSD